MWKKLFNTKIPSSLSTCKLSTLPYDTVACYFSLNTVCFVAMNALDKPSGVSQRLAVQENSLAVKVSSPKVSSADITTTCTKHSGHPCFGKQLGFLADMENAYELHAMPVYERW